AGSAPPSPAADKSGGEIGRRARQGPAGAGRLIIEDRVPGAAEIVGLPDAAIIDADVEDIGLLAHAPRAHGAPAAERTDHAPAHAVVELGRQLLAISTWPDVQGRNHG